MNPLTIDDLKFPEGKLPELLIYDWGNAGKTFAITVLTRHGFTSQVYTSSANRSMSTRTFRVDDLPLAVMARAEEANVRRGEIYVLVNLRLGQVIPFCLFCGYVSHERRLTWPPGVFEGMVEGPGLLRSITGTDPAAGAEVLETVPTNARWHLIAVNLNLATDATVATRRVNLYIDDGTTGLLYIVGGATQAASLTNYYRYASHFPRETAMVISNLLTPIPEPLILGQGYRIQTITTNLQAGDNYGAPQLLVEEWLEE